MTADMLRAVGADVATEPAVLKPGPDGSLGTLLLSFSPFQRWYVIDSAFEGRFLERTVPGAFKRTIAERGSGIRVQFDHGRDSRIGSLPLGLPQTISERATGPEAVVPLFDTSYVRDVLPALRAGALGASFRFVVAKGGDSWVTRPGKSAHNPEGLPERSLRDLDCIEAGPVVFPANAAATAGMRADDAAWITPTLPKQRGGGGFTPSQRRKILHIIGSSR